MRSNGLTNRARVDLATRNPTPATARTVMATLLAVAVSLGANALLVLIGTSLWAADRGYSHFGFWDYGSLTVLGVGAAGASWPLVARISPSARWLFLRTAVAVSLVLLLPDVWLLSRGQPVRAVAVLVAMHVVIALVTYNLLVRLAPPLAGRAVEGGARPPVLAPAGWRRRIWIGMSTLSVVTGLLGIAAIVAVRVNRPSAWLPTTGRVVYLAHGAAGGVLGIGAAVLVIALLRADRISLYSAVAGLAVVGLGAAGGVLSVYSAVRYEGMALMLAGTLVAPFAYLAPIGLADADPAAPTNREWGDLAAEGGTLACRNCGPVTELREAAGLDEEAWIDDRVSAGRCPLCRSRALEGYKDVWICWCCETVYRPGAGGDVAWVVTPGVRVGRG